MPERIGSALVVGAGIGGMQAALDLAESGIKVYLVENKPCIGGIMSQLDKTFPTNDCAMCTMAPRLVEVGRHKDIKIITLADVESIQGDAGNFKVKLKQRARYILEEKCTGCGECVEKCPIEIPSEHNLGLDEQKAIYRLYPQAVPNTFAIKKLGQSPCRFGCPAGQRAQGYIALIREKRYEDAYKTILYDNLFPSVCGRVCKHYCEDECSRQKVDAPVSIMRLKRFIADWAYNNKSKIKNLPTKSGSRLFVGEKSKIEKKGKKVAIIGAGPAGLTAAFDLTNMGYQVTVFEALSEAGGMIRYGVPDFRLPKERLQWDIENILSSGFELKTNHKIKSIDALLKNGFNAVFISVGTHIGKKLRIPGSDLPDVLVNTDFLRKVAMGEKVSVGEKVLVLGGGNVAMDVARTVLRLGAKEVKIACLESKEKIPADSWEIEEAEKEGIQIFPSRTFLEIVSKEGRVAGVKCLQVNFRGFAQEGSPDMDLIKESVHILEADTVIFAIGQTPEIPFKDERIELTKFGTIKVDEQTLATSKPVVFAGGDVVTGTKFIVDAIACGHKAASSIDAYLNDKEFKLPEKTKVELTEEEIKEKIKSEENRHIPFSLPVEERKGFKEVESTFTEEEALKEAERCLECAICSECLMCQEVCQAEAISHEMPKESYLDLEVGAIVVSVGSEVFKAELKPELGYLRYPNVLTALEFERILSASGPFQGKVLRLSDKKTPKRIAFIQCVGLREVERNYCSSVCCMFVTKEAIIAKEHAPEIECTIFYIDLRAFGKGFEAYYERAKKLGIRYIRCRPSAIKEVLSTRNLKVQYQDNGKIQEEEFDLAVLSTGFAPVKSSQEISQRLGIKLNEFNFGSTSVFEPVESSREGIYICGPFTQPQDIPETVMQASASSSKVLCLLKEVKGSLITAKEYPPEMDVVAQEPRVGVFVCHCGTNIAGVVDVPSVVEYVKRLPNVVYAEDNLYTCSNDTQEKIKAKIKEQNLNRIVVASCSPRTHEPLFRNTLREIGLNPYLFEMANIRDQCSWVHMFEPEKATQKAKDLVRMSIAKARLLEPLQKGKISVKKSALVIGGGLSGMTASLELAKQGFDVYLIEKEKQLGGNLRKLHYLLSQEDPQEELRALIEKLKNQPQIQIFTSANIENVEGSIGNFKTKLSANGGLKELEHGIAIVASGAKQYQPKEYLYGEDERVLTQLELEEKIVKNEPRAPSPEPRTIVMIQCVGSRDNERPYCSRICCSEAIKNALKIKEISPQTNIYILYRDIRTYGFREKYYTQAREKGVIFIRYEEDKKPEVSKEGSRLWVKVFDQLLKMTVSLDTDLLVLSAGIVADEENKTLAQFLKVPLNQDRFFLEAHMKLRPVDFATDGVFLCGLAHSPKSIDESIIQAQASAGRASTILSKDEIELEANISFVLDENCDGCAYCIDPCPYKALTLLEYMKDGAIKKTVEVNESICKGCGTCQATCPMKGIYVRGFKPEQIAIQVEAALVSD